MRRTNQMVALCSLIAALWLSSLHVTVTIASEKGLPWLRLTTAIGAFIPLSLWLVKEAITSSATGPSQGWRHRGWLWLGASLGLAIICFTDLFIPSYSTDDKRVYGIGYYVYIGGLISLYLTLCIRAFTRIRSLTGLPRLELQVWLLGGSGASLCVLLLMLARTLFKMPINLQGIVVLVFFGWTSIAITTHRIFDARHLLLTAAQKTLLWLFVVAGAYAFSEVAGRYLPSTIVFGLTIAVVLSFAGWLGGRLDQWLLRYPNAIQARTAAFQAAQSEINTDSLRKRFHSILNGWGQSDHAILLIEDEDKFCDNGISVQADDLFLAALEEVIWATPERLVRERETPARLRLASFLREHDLGAVVMERSSALTLVVGVGLRPSRRPFTYPEIVQLRELASIFESALSRTQLLAKAQRAEQLATVGLLGAGVAHEIRNPLVSIKTFAQLLPKHYDDPNFRERFSRLIGEEVARIDRLTEQLLDLAAPRAFQRSTVALHELVRASIDLVSARVSSRNVQIRTELTAAPDTVFSDANGLKQVILNLCFNAVQAQEEISPELPVVVCIATRRAGKFVELSVADDGPGIPDNSRAHLFDPFHSSKSNGFGLGLTVCSDILASLDSTIALDPYEADRGAVFRITLPCPPPSS
ncbi:ATP-binding protein [Synoicihabitans lomoniglobus]|uniref:histidine kinase n=1 Tax=Synoicihabitans lomoniglobus TaxID=2909285 RepID=A0AAE9ZXG4_9BACT|nr:ATP-binding protein [Opitutaceae bacterium LMO-M01]